MTVRHRARAVRRSSAVPVPPSPRGRDGYRPAAPRSLARLEIPDDLFRNAQILGQKRASELPIFDRLPPRKGTEAGDGASTSGYDNFFARFRASDKRGELGLSLCHRNGCAQCTPPDIGLTIDGQYWSGMLACQTARFKPTDRAEALPVRIGGVEAFADPPVSG